MCPQPRVIGRDAEIAELDAFVGALADGFAALVLRGEPGIGKTTVWDSGIVGAAEAGASVLTARPVEAEAGLSFAALADLLAPVEDRALERLPDPQREALASALLKAPAPPGGIDERAVSVAVLSLVKTLSEEGPLVLGIDDAHWLDSPSERVLGFVLRRLVRERVGVLFTVRSSGGASSQLTPIALRQGGRSVEVGPVSLAALHELIKLHS